MYMSNDSRKITRFLKSKFSDRPEPNIDEIIAMEQAILAYYPNPIIKIMEDMMSKAKPEKLANYASFSYHLPGLRRITSKRCENPRKLIGWESFKETMLYLQRVLLVVDYNIDTLLIIINMVDDLDNNKYNEGMIFKAVLTAKQAGVYSVQYVYAILQREIAERQAVVARAIEIVELAETAEVEQKQAGVSTIERMSIQAMWTQRAEDSELEQKLRRMGY